MATLQQKQRMIDCLRSRVITITLDKHSYDQYHRAWEDADQDGLETAYWNLRDDLVHQLQQQGYAYADERDDWDQWHDAFEYAYLDGASQAPVFRLHTGEDIKLMFEWV